MADFSWDERIDKRATPTWIASEPWTIPSCCPKFITLYEVPQDLGCGNVYMCDLCGCPYSECYGVPPVGTFEFCVDYCSGIVYFSDIACSGRIVNVCYNGLGSLVWSRDVNELGGGVELMNSAKLERDGSQFMCGSINMCGFNINNVCCVNGLNIYPHNHSGSSMGVNLNGSVICVGTLPADRIAAGGIGGGLISDNTIYNNHLAIDNLSVCKITSGVLQTNGTMLGIKTAATALADVTFTNDNTDPKIMFYHSGTRDFGIGVKECSSNMFLSLFIPPPSLPTCDNGFFIRESNISGTPLAQFRTTCGVLGPNVLVWENASNTIGLGIVPDCVNALRVCGNIRIGTDKSIKFDESGTAHNVISACSGCVGLGGCTGFSGGTYIYGGSTTPQISITSSGTTLTGGVLACLSSSIGNCAVVVSSARLYVKGEDALSNHYAIYAVNNAGSPLLSVSNAGCVGINTGAPSRTLDVNGDACICNSLYAGGTVYITGNNQVTGSLFVNGTSSLLKNTTINCLNIAGSGNPRFVLPTGAPAPAALTKGALWVI